MMLDLKRAEKIRFSGRAARALLLFFFALTPFFALAQDKAEPLPNAAHVALSTEVLKASGLNVMFDNAAPNVVGALRANLSRQRPELIKDMEEVLKLVAVEQGKAAESGLKDAATAFATKFSEAELTEILAFLTSPVGRKYVGQLPAFTEEIVPFLQAWSKSTSEKLSQFFVLEMNKRGHKL